MGTVLETAHGVHQRRRRAGRVMRCVRIDARAACVPVLSPGAVGDVKRLVSMERRERRERRLYSQRLDRRSRMVRNG